MYIDPALTDKQNYMHLHRFSKSLFKEHSQYWLVDAANIVYRIYMVSKKLDVADVIVDAVCNSTGCDHIVDTEVVYDALMWIMTEEDRHISKIRATVTSIAELNLDKLLPMYTESYKLHTIDVANAMDDTFKTVIERAIQEPVICFYRTGIIRHKQVMYDHTAVGKYFSE